MDWNFLGSFGAWIIEHGGETIVALTALVTFFSVIANFTKTDADNKIVAFVSKLVNWLALNVVNKPKA
jgi:hypothetical protein